MTMEYLANLGSMIGGLAIFVSLLYLAVETRVNTKAIQSAAHHSANISFADMQLTLGANPELAEFMNKSMVSADFGEFTDHEKFRFSMLAGQVFWRNQDFYDQYRHGAIEKELWENRRIFARSLLERPLFQAWWQHQRGTRMYSSAFIEAIDTAPLTEKPYFDQFVRE